MKHLDLFSGIGGFSLAASWVWEDHNPIFCEIEPYCQKVIRKHWPTAQIIDDIHKLKGDQYGTIDILTGGFPCQPYSTAGERNGKKDERALWPQMYRVIKESRPYWIIGENVPGLDGMGLDEICRDLETIDYEVGEPLEIPALSVGFDHIRTRIFIVAHSCREFSTFGVFNRYSRKKEKWSKTEEIRCEDWFKPEMGTEIDRGIQRWEEFSEPKMVRITNGLSQELDEIRCLGNAIVPQVVYPIMLAIKSLHNS